MYISNLLLRS